MSYDLTRLVNLGHLISLGENVLSQGYQTQSQVEDIVAIAVREKGNCSLEIVDTVPQVAEAVKNVLYIVYNEDTTHYDIYSLVGDSVVRLDDTTVDLSSIENSIDVINSSLSSLASRVTKNEQDIATNVESIKNLQAASKEVATDEEVSEAINEVFN